MSGIIPSALQVLRLRRAVFQVCEALAVKRALTVADVELQVSKQTVYTGATGVLN
jgi:hypothetical protein